MTTATNRYTNMQLTTKRWRKQQIFTATNHAFLKLNHCVNQTHGTTHMQSCSSYGISLMLVHLKNSSTVSVVGLLTKKNKQTNMRHEGPYDIAHWALFKAQGTISNSQIWYNHNKQRAFLVMIYSIGIQNCGSGRRNENKVCLLNFIAQAKCVLIQKRWAP